MLLDSWKRTYITLISKVAYPKDMNDFRPCSLCNTIYKLVAKLLMNWLKPILPSIFSVEQGAFAKGRNIHNNILLAQELLHSLEKASPSRSLIMVKLDMEKFYDQFH